MFTQPPEIINEATVGQVVVQPTATATPTSSASATSTGLISPSSSPTAGPVYTYSPRPTLPPIKRFRDNALIIYGYGPINSKVTLKGFGVTEETISDNSGLFVFNRVYSLSFRYPELCIQAMDDLNRFTQPSCIPSLPLNSLIPLEVGPILLSPTISLSDNRVVEGQRAFLMGKTTPDTLVNIYIYKISEKEKLNIVGEVSAYSLPVVESVSDENGKFEINLPTGFEAEYNIFATSKFNENQSAKSNTLKFVVTTDVKLFWQSVWSYIINNKMLMVIIVEAAIIVLLFIMALKSTTKRNKRHSEHDYLSFNNELKM